MTTRQGSTKTFGKAKPTQAPRYVKTHSHAQEDQDKSVMGKPPVKGDNKATLVLSVICGLSFLVLGGAGAAYFLNSPTAVHAKASSHPAAQIDGAKHFAMKFEECKRKTFRKNPRASKLQKHFEQSAKSFAAANGVTIRTNPRLMLCIAGLKPGPFCNSDFRREYSSLVSEFYSEPVARMRAQGEFFGKMASMSYKKNKPKRKNYVRQIKGKIQSLFANGYLRRKEFNSFLGGEPEWVSNIFSTIEISKSSCGNLSNS